MLDTAPRTVVLLDGGIESLTCAAIALDRGEGSEQSHKVVPLAFLEFTDTPANASRQRAISRQFEYLGDASRSGDVAPSIGRQGLIKAIDLAGPDGTILWGRRCSECPDAIADTLALAEHLTGIARYSQPSCLIQFDLPLLDLTAGQVLDLASTLGAPLGACWSCEHTGPEPCGDCPSCLSWLEASRESGRPLPRAGSPTPG